MRIVFLVCSLFYGCLPVVMIASAAQDGGWSAAVTALALVLACLGVFAVSAFTLWLFSRGTFASRVIEIDKDRRVLQMKIPRGLAERGPDRLSIPFAAIRAVYAHDGCVRIETPEGVHQPIDYNHKRSRAEAERIARRIEELVVAETGERLARVRIEDGERVQTDAAYEAEAEREAELARERDR